MNDHLTDSLDRNAREMEVERSHDLGFERLLGAVAMYEDICEEFAGGLCDWDEVRRQRSIVELCAMRMNGGI